MQIFDSTSYKSILKKRILERKIETKTITFEKVASAAKVQKTYFSKVLNGDAQLNEDQLFRVCRFLGATDEEQEYLMLLLQLERCEDKARRSFIETKISDLQKKHQTTMAHLPPESTVYQAGFERYFLDPTIQLVHIFLCIPAYAENVAAIASKLKIPKDKFEEILSFLNQYKVIAWEKGKLKMLRESIHIDSKSEYYDAYKSLMRLNAMQNMDTIVDENRFEFSVFFSADETFRKRLKSTLNQLIGDTEKLVRASPQKDVYFMQIDLLKRS